MSTVRDARAVRSARAMEAALLALLARKPLEQITIREVAAEAGVSYATFFRHHPTKEALLDHVAADQIEALVGYTLPLFDRADATASVRALCAYVAEHRALWAALLTGGAAASMRQALLRVSREVASTRAPANGWLPVELGVACSVSLISEVLAWWLGQRPGAVSPDEAAAVLHRLLAGTNLIGTAAGD